MNSERWQKVKALFDVAQEIPLAKREKFLDKVCAGDVDLRREVEKLLSSLENPTSFMEQPAVKEVASLIIERNFIETNNELESGQVLSHYRISAKIGEGGMGDVYLAKDTRLNRRVAIKLLSVELSKNENHLRRFVQEARAASALNHPNIITVYEIGEFEDTHFIAAEYIEGETLRERLSGELTLNEVLDITTQMASALSAAHKAGIVHRDVKPENVMIRREDNLIKVLDFGLAKLTEQQAISDEDATLAQVKTNSGVIMGTVAYMSPEQARGQQVDERTDIWSFGAVLYEMLAQKQPFAGETVSDAIAAILKNEPAPLGENTPPELNRIIRKTLQKNVDERYQTVKDLLLDLKNLKRQVEFSEEIERSHTPSFAKSANVAATQPSENVTAIQPAVSTQNSISPQTSSAEYAIGEVKKHKFVSLGLLAAFFVALAVIGYFAFFATRTATAINSVAVLPFVNGSNDPNLDYLSDGLSESVIDRLSQLPQLKVIARSSSFKYRGENIDVQDVANKLAVQAIVMGKVARVGDNLSVRVEMIDASENRQLWSEQYSRKAADLISIQLEIAQTASEKLHLRLSGAQEQQLEKRETINPQAFELLLKGNFFFNKEGTEGWRKANEYYRQAVAVDPNYALAHAQLSLSYMVLAGLGNDPKDFFQKAEAAVRKALELDEKLSNAHFMLANIHKYAWELAPAEAEFKRALELNPNLGDAHREYSFYLCHIGRHDEAFAEAKRARELDPLNLLTNAHIGYALYFARRYDESIEALQKTLELDPNYDLAYAMLGYTYAAKGMHREAIIAYQNAIRLSGGNRNMQSPIGVSSVYTGERGKAQEILKQLQTGKEYVSPVDLAILYAALGDKEAAYQSLAKAYAERSFELISLKVDPSFDPLRNDRRFLDLMRQVGLPQ
jgi:serine/threonine-protein kinase